MRIIYVTSKLPYSSQEALIIPEIEELIRRGHEVLIVPMYPRGAILHGEVKPMLEHSIIKPLISPNVAKWAAIGFIRAPIKALRTLSWVFRSRSAQILLKNLAVYPKGLWLAHLAHERKVDHIHAHWAASTATMALIAGEVSSVPWSLTAHRYDIPERSLLDAKAKSACFIRAEDKQGARELRSYVSSETFEPVVLHMGVNIHPLTNREHLHNKRAVRIVTPANLLEKKGHIYLVEAVKLLKDHNVSIYWDLAGDGPLREQLTRRVGELGLTDQVTFLGALPHDTLMKKLRAGVWDMVVLPSIVTSSGEKEGIPVTLIEALSCYVPVVSTTTGGISELFEGIDGSLLVPPRNPTALAEAISKLIEDCDLRERLTESGRKRVEESFAIEQVVTELIRRFEACVGGKT
jgi:colanic acid/amylovoran biosynthesis glycosyltransferase